MQEVQTRFDDINRKINEANEKYRLLKHLEHNLMLAANPRFTHGPLFDDPAEKPIETKIVQNVNQLRPEDRADEEKHRFDFVDR